MTNPISVSHQKHYYRVVFRSMSASARVDADDDRDFRSRCHVLPLGKRDYDAPGETEQDAIQYAKNLLALDRLLDDTREQNWEIDSIARY